MIATIAARRPLLFTARRPAITLALGGFWVVSIVATAIYFWLRRSHWRAPAKAPAESGVNAEAELG